ncbi:hypothetical protein OIU74_013354 [Salix koriyanagi]|uniref:Uncharacterized protein n=1 Tax=Salix koriyanagi TaxID=2511006 RepID=A0A9Q0Q900_9ROSI|nr:hypothetical protein OIU74_013354 [Salix koriyanagi]
MKIKNKGKVYPSPSSSSSSSSVGDNGDRDVLSVFKLLPAAILALASVLSLEDREVLAYMITRSLKTTTTTTNNPSSSLQDSKKKSSKKTQNNNNSQNKATGSGGTLLLTVNSSIKLLKPLKNTWPVVKCQGNILEVREETKRVVGPVKNLFLITRVKPEMLPVPETSNSTTPESSSSSYVADVVNVNAGFTDNSLSPEKVAEREEMEESVKLYDEVPEEVDEEETAVAAAAAATHGVAVCSHHKGLARKVLPDVLGLLNSRLWNLWSPNV